MASTHDPRSINRIPYLKSTIEKLAEKQMKNGLHVRFLENCLEDDLVPSGLRLKLKIHIGNDETSKKFQESIDSLLKKVSLEICDRLKEVHQRRAIKLGNELEEHRDELKSIIKGNTGIFDEELLKKTESKKEKLMACQIAKLQKLNKERNNYTGQQETIALQITNEKSKRSNQKPKESAKADKFVSVKTKRKVTQYRERNEQPMNEIKVSPTAGITIGPKHKEHINLSVQNRSKINQAKNLIAPGTQKVTYADAVKNGAKKITQESSNTNITILATIQKLMGTLTNLLQTTQREEKIGDLLKWKTRTDGGKKGKEDRKSKEERKLY